jgi:uncharacterized protein with PQ loop repeat
MIQAVGFTAGTLTALAFLPQLVKVWRTRSAEDLSTAMLDELVDAARAAIGQLRKGSGAL